MQKKDAVREELHKGTNETGKDSDEAANPEFLQDRIFST